MRLLKIAVASVSPTVGAVRSNTDRLVALAGEMAREHVTLGCFPEQAIGGYPPEDLIQWRAFVAAQRRELERFADATAAFPTVFVLGVTIAVGGQLFNAAAVVHRGRIVGLVPKEKLPTYNIFYEARTLSRGGPGLALDADGVPLGDYLFAFDFGTLAVEVCEDAWSPDGPIRRRAYSGAEIVVNVSASPYRIGVTSTRREMLATRSADNQVTLAYANAVGAQDGLIFDGGGYVFQNGRLLLEAARFREGFETCIVDRDRTRRLRQENTTWRSDCEAFQRAGRLVPAIRCDAPTTDPARLAYPAPAGGSFFLPPDGLPTVSPRASVLDELYEALALGVKEYVRKSAAFTGLGVAVSGGRDSVLTLLIAWRAAQMLHCAGTPEAIRDAAARTITAFYLPSRFSGSRTRTAAETICRELGVPLRVVPIDEAFERELEATRRMLGDSTEPSALTIQNIQARVRAARMWNWANTAGALFLQTGDMSEKAVGYTTIGGDLEGGLSVIANLPKTVVTAMLERLHQRFGFEGIRLALAVPAGPELAPEQAAEAELMPFEVLDACLYLYAGEKLAPSELASALTSLFPDRDPARLASWAAQFVERFTRSIYKWVQSPLSLHVGSLDLERERALQLPVIQRNEWDG
ncbi:MAG TPA: NAD(+) synthase [Vicinamibacterales bacterium]|nr:NAD(+) synthase [Vicinamibacterales bacterium]